jgi:hypothetical protein
VHKDIELKFRTDSQGHDVSWVTIVKQIWASLKNELEGNGFTQDRANKVMEDNLYNVWYKQYGQVKEHVSPAIMFGDKRMVGKDPRKVQFAFHTTLQNKLWKWMRSKKLYKRGKQDTYIGYLINAIQDRDRYEAYVAQKGKHIQVKQEPHEEMQYDAEKELRSIYDEKKNYWVKLANEEFVLPISEAFERNKFGIPLLEHLVTVYRKYLSGEDLRPLAKVIEYHRHIDIHEMLRQYNPESLKRANVDATRGVLQTVRKSLNSTFNQIRQHYTNNPLSTQAINEFKNKKWPHDDGFSKMAAWLSKEIVKVSEDRLAHDKQQETERAWVRRPYSLQLKHSLSSAYYKNLRIPILKDTLEKTHEAVQEIDDEIDKIKKDSSTVEFPKLRLHVLAELRKELISRHRNLVNIYNAKIEGITNRLQAERLRKKAIRDRIKKERIDQAAAVGAIDLTTPPASPAVSPQVSPSLRPIQQRPDVSPPVHQPPRFSANLSPPDAISAALPRTVEFAPPLDMPQFGMEPRQLFMGPVVSPARQAHPRQQVVNLQAHPISPQEQQEEEKAWEEFKENEGGEILQTDFVYNRVRRDIRPRLKYYKTRQHYVIPVDKPYVIGGDQVQEIAYVERHQIPEHAPEENQHELFVKELKKEPVYHASKKVSDIGDNIRVSLFNHSIHFYFSGSPVQRALKIMAERIEEQAHSTRNCRLLTTRMVKGKRIMRTIISKRDLQHTPRIAIQNILARSTAKHFILRYEGSGGSIHRRYQNKMHLL